MWKWDILYLLLFIDKIVFSPVRNIGEIKTSLTRFLG